MIIRAVPGCTVDEPAKPVFRVFWRKRSDTTAPERQPGAAYLPVPCRVFPERVTEYPRRYRVTLDEQGVLRVHLGEVPYWKTEDLQDWKAHPGRVLQRDLELVEPPARESRDPFCGVH